MLRNPSFYEHEKGARGTYSSNGLVLICQSFSSGYHDFTVIPSKHIGAGHHRPTSGQPAEHHGWRFAGGPMVPYDIMMATWNLFCNVGIQFVCFDLILFVPSTIFQL